MLRHIELVKSFLYKQAQSFNFVNEIYYIYSALIIEELEDFEISSLLNYAAIFQIDNCPVEKIPLCSTILHYKYKQLEL